MRSFTVVWRDSLSPPRLGSGAAPPIDRHLEKAVVLGFSLIKNHLFVDGNKRVGHAALEVMLMLNGNELTASKESTEAVVLAVASGTA